MSNFIEATPSEAREKFRAQLRKGDVAYVAACEHRGKSFNQLWIKRGETYMVYRDFFNFDSYIVVKPLKAGQKSVMLQDRKTYMLNQPEQQHYAAYEMDVLDHDNLGVLNVSTDPKYAFLEAQGIIW